MDLYDVTAKNFGPYVELHVDLYKQGLVWVGGRNKDTTSATSNGAGKTSLFRAITWCLYGEIVDDKSGDKVIHKGSTRAEVAIRLLDGDKWWAVKRSRTRGAPRLELVTPDGHQFKASKDEIQRKIIEMVGLDFKAFKNTVLYGQNDSARFAHPRTKDSERKEMLHRIMRTELLGRCHEWIKGKAKELRDHLSEKQAEVDKLMTRIEEHDISALKVRRDALDQEREDNIGSYRRQAKEHKAKAVEYAKKASSDIELPDLDAYKKKVNEAEKRASASSNAGELLDEIEKELEEIHDKYRTIEREQQLRRRDMVNLENKLKDLEGDVCPTCTSPLTEGKAQEHLKSLKREHLVLEQVVNQYKVDLRKIQKTAANKSDQAEKQRQEANKFGLLMDRVAEHRAELARAEARAEALQLQAEEATEHARYHVRAAKHMIQAIKDEQAKINPYDTQIAEAKAKVAQYRKNIKELESGMKVANNELAHYEFWSRGFSNQGLPSYVLDSVMPYITERANHYLETLADGDINMEFSTQRELSSNKGNYRDEIDIRWAIEGLDDSYPPSGGQLKKMEIATDLALMDLVATREGGHLDMLMLDEVLDGLDSEGCARVLRLLQKIRAVRGTIFVISHETEVSEVFERAIYAVKKNGNTKLVAEKSRK